ncbi:MAG: hypothetical protein K2M17_04565, partial [Bacilli bacterium]|nr:hypothetical protein [Bacilli bacterium]
MGKFKASEITGYAAEIKSSFAKMKQILDDIEVAYQACCNTRNWDAQTNTYFQKECKKLFATFNNMKSKFNNVNEFLEAEINNNHMLQEDHKKLANEIASS